MQNILESQVSDLSCLVNSPLPLGGIGVVVSPNSNTYPTPGGRSVTSQQHAHRRSVTSGMPAVTTEGMEQSTRGHSSAQESPNQQGRERADSAAATGKRKGDEAGNANGASQPRAKRNRYISIACNECKRRKIKCNGNTPCQRCGNLNLECQYAANCCSSGFKDSEEFKAMNAHLASLQEQVDNLYASMTALRNSEMNGRSFGGSISQRSLTSQSPATLYRPPPKRSIFQGPTSSAFGFDVAKNTLQNMGYQGIGEGGEDGQGLSDETPMGSPPTKTASLQLHPYRDPLWAITKEEAKRLIMTYEDEMGVMYPFLDTEWLMSVADAQFRIIEQENMRGNSATTLDGAEAVPDNHLNQLKIVLAIGSVLENHGQSEYANRLYENVRPAADEIMRSEGVDVKELPLLALIAMFHFHCDEEVLAWRTIGHASRMCVELGLHRRDALFKNFPIDDERANAVRLFWSIYCLDRRWSFGTGLPFALQDADIDPTLPEPEVKLPYLFVMISYSRIGSRVWRSVAGFDATLSAPEVKKEDIGYLDYQILQWQKSIPQELQLPTAASPQTTSRAMHRLQVLLYLRCNQMRMLIYRPVLHSANSILENLSFARTVVDLAKDTIRALTHLNQTTDIYRAQQVCFNYFLISALAVIFLASCHAPVQFSAICKEEFYMALDLVRGFSSKSYVSKRLWRTIKGLKEVGPKLGLEEAPQEDPHSSAALVMAGLAGHDTSSFSQFNTQSNGHTSGHQNQGMQMGGMTGQGNSPMSGFQMSAEMTNLFEAALGAGTGLQGGYTGPVQDGSENGGAVMAHLGAGVFGGEEELYRQLRDLF